MIKLIEYHHSSVVRVSGLKSAKGTHKLQDNCLEIQAIFGFGQKHEEELASLVLQNDFLLLPKYHLNYKSVTTYYMYIFLQSKSLQSYTCYAKLFLHYFKLQYIDKVYKLTNQTVLGRPVFPLLCTHLDVWEPFVSVVSDHTHCQGFLGEPPNH